MVGRSNRGVALLAVLWITMLLGIIAAGLLSSTRTDTQLARNLLETARARALAEAGVSLAVLQLLESDEYGLQPDGRPYVFHHGSGSIRVSVHDESGKINVNFAPPALLAGLLLAVGLEESRAARLADAVIDWRDPDDLRRLNGAEAADYRRAGLPYLPRDAPFPDLAEIRLVLGMTSELYQRVAPFLTVHSRARQVDSRTAPREVLLALPGVHPTQIDNLLAARATLAESADAATALHGQGFVGVSPLAGAGAIHAGSRRQDTFTVRAEARTERGGVFVREALIRLHLREGAPSETLAWRQGEAQIPPLTESVVGKYNQR